MSLIKCENCGKEVSDTAKQCIHCGASIVKKTICKECNTEVEASKKVCPNCGSKISVMDAQSIIDGLKTKKGKNILILVVLVIIVIFIVSCFFGESSVLSKIDMQDVYESIGCTSSYCKVASDGSYLEIDTNPYDIDDYYSASAVDYVKKANEKLGFSEALYSKMGKTRALDGTLTDSNDKVSVSWTYHPDKGLKVTYEVK